LLPDIRDRRFVDNILHDLDYLRVLCDISLVTELAVLSVNVFMMQHGWTESQAFYGVRITVASIVVSLMIYGNMFCYSNMRKLRRLERSMELKLQEESTA
jgi:hypothetical protein